MKTLKWGLIGCGDIAHRRIGPALTELESCELQAVSRQHASELESCVAHLGAKRGYDDWKALLLDKTIEAVYIATPVHLHSEQTINAAKSGKHVLCEKPMAMNTVECEKMIDACNRNKVHIGVAYYRRFYPVVELMKTIIAKGEIGRVMFIQINASETPLILADHPRSWLIKKEKAGGGVLMDFGCHRIEVMLNLMGRIAEVKGVTGKVYPENEVEDVATVSIKFENNACGVLTVMRGGTINRDTVYIQGTNGSIQVENLNEGSISFKTGNRSYQDTLPKAENGHLPLIESFTQAILNNKAPKVDGNVGLGVQRVIEAAYKH